MNAATHPSAPQTGPQLSWPASLDAREWDQRFPGILDGALILAGAANVILQLARPGVGYGVVESRVHTGSLFKNPAKRTRTTLTYLAVALMGTQDEKLAYRKAVNRSHAQVHATEASPVAYNAFDPNLQLWVAACLFFGIVDSYGKIYGPLSREQEADFYALAEPLGTTLQVRPGMWPADLDAFYRYWDAGLAELHIDDTIREHLRRITDLEFMPRLVRGPLGRFNRFVTAGFLPQKLRDEMHFEWSAGHQRQFDRLMGVIGSINRLMPRAVRQLPFRLMLRDFRRRLHKGQPLV